MKLCEGVVAVDVACYIEASKTLVISDVHIGLEESLNKQGVLVPKRPFTEVLDRLQAIMDVAKPTTVVLNGDIKDQFGSIGPQEWRNVKKLIDYIQQKAKLVVVKGNHDTVLDPIAKDRNLSLVTSYNAGGMTIMHGDTLPDPLPKVLIIGHYHPAVRLREDRKSELYKCFLKITQGKSTIIVQPSFNTLKEGSDVINNPPDLAVPAKTEVFVVDKQVLPFGRLADLV